MKKKQSESAKEFIEKELSLARTEEREKQKVKGERNRLIFLASIEEDPEETCPYKGMKHGHCNVCGLLTTPEMKCKCEFRNPSQSIEEEKWEKCFDKKYFGELGIGTFTPKWGDDIKDFIKDLLSLARTEEAIKCSNHCDDAVAEYKAELADIIKKRKEKIEDIYGTTITSIELADIINLISPNKE